MRWLRKHMEARKKALGEWWGDCMTTSSEERMLDSALREFDQLTEVTKRAIDALEAKNMKLSTELRQQVSQIVEK